MKNDYLFRAWVLMMVSTTIFYYGTIWTFGKGYESHGIALGILFCFVWIFFTAKKKPKK